MWLRVLLLHIVLLGSVVSQGERDANAIENSKESGESISVELYNATNYCDPSLCEGHPHVACNAELYNYGSKCEISAQLLNLKRDTEQFIVDKLNEFRNQVARGGFQGFLPASHMPALSWDKELAYLARLNVQKCSLVFDKCRNTMSSRDVGQSIAYKGLKGNLPLLEDIISDQLLMWFNENSGASMMDILKYRGHNVGKPKDNFLQMILQDNEKVGCAVLQQSKNDWMQTYITCNYDHSPVANKPIYETSPTAADHCPDGQSRKFQFLCSTLDNEKEESPYAMVDNFSSDSSEDESKKQKKKSAKSRTHKDGVVHEVTTLKKNKIFRVKGNTLKRKFGNFLRYLNKAKKKTENTHVVILTSNHEVDDGKNQNEEAQAAKVLARRTRLMQKSLRSQARRIRNRGIMSRTMKHSRMIKQTARSRSGLARSRIGNGHAIWRTLK
ncbi:allergen Tab y 5.0101 [Scaptodrosophila lebanonensis]|uniref:Allergen Tab y 5.0101 n=1 Tax=Drosophila lebanonensis TaxID=7225 RepID=A0A6J2UFS0_DROLE|nr:allergen Tab y 5.0101 [Scaptodrosophila lebanonensis]